MSEIKKNITSIFIVPTLKISRENLQNNGFINGYVIDIDYDVSYENCVYLLFKPKDIEKFRDFLSNEYERTKSIIEDYDYKDGFVVVVYQLDNKFKKDFDLIKQGKYSKTSVAFQEQFPKVIKIKKNGYLRDEISLQYRVFNKTEDMKLYWEEKLGVSFDENMEVWGGWDEEKEILNFEKMKDYVQ